MDIKAAYYSCKDIIYLLQRSTFLTLLAYIHLLSEELKEKMESLCVSPSYLWTYHALGQRLMEW